MEVAEPKKIVVMCPLIYGGGAKAQHLSFCLLSMSSASTTEHDMLIERDSPIEHLKAFAICFAAGYLASEAASLYRKWVIRRRRSASPEQA